MPKAGLGKISLIFACGTALFSDGYANNIIGSVVTILIRIYGKDSVSQNNFATVLRSLAFAGTIVGMLSFGYISDKLGRKFGMMAATAIVALFSGLSAASQGAGSYQLPGLLAMLSAMRFLLGIGIGAEYPCGSVAASEQTEEEGIAKNAQNRWFALATNTMIDLGFVVSSVVPLILYKIFGDDHLRAVWRVSLGLGIVPALAVFIWRLKMEEPTLYKKDAMTKVKTPYWLIFKRYWVGMVGICLTWFIYDFIAYPFGLYSSTVVDNITGGAQDFTTVFGWNTVINLFYLPGTIIGAFVVDYLGPRNTMITGLLFQAVIGFIMSGLYERLSQNIGAFAVVYGIFLSFGEFGPGNCLGLLASKTSPTAVRGQYYGLAAAIGKVGAFVGTWAFPPIIERFGGSESSRGNTGPFWIASGLAILSAIITFVMIDPISSDRMAKEDAEFRIYLEKNGFDTSQMGLGLTDTDSEANISDVKETSTEKLPPPDYKESEKAVAEGSSNPTSKLTAKKSNDPTAKPAEGDDTSKDASSTQLGMLEEDDEFEEFATADWDDSQTPSGGEQLWQDGWDDDDIEEEFSMQLRQEISKISKGSDSMQQS